LASSLLLVSVDCASPARLADFWSEVLDYKVRHELPDGAHLITADPGAAPWLAFLPVPEEKRTKNRLHLDLSADDQDAEVERLIALGATRADVGQPADSPWVVLADPEGNEFCVLPPRS
jgi:predicted enzyme related to lactoylglutathione lyase